MKVPRPYEGVAAVVVVPDGRAEDWERHGAAWQAPCRRASFVAGPWKAIAGMSLMELNLQMALGVRRAGAALISALCCRS